MADYDQAVKLNPNYAIACNNRGILSQMKGDLTGAIADYNQSIKLNPNNALAYNNR